jgi:hypothetical protein
LNHPFRIDAYAAVCSFLKVGEGCFAAWSDLMTLIHSVRAKGKELLFAAPFDYNAINAGVFRF